MTAWKGIFESLNNIFKTLYSVCNSFLLWKVISSWCGGGDGGSECKSNDRWEMLILISLWCWFEAKARQLIFRVFSSRGVHFDFWIVQIEEKCQDNFDFSLVWVWGGGKASRLLRQGSSVPDPVKRAPSVGALDCRGRVATVYPKCTYIHMLPLHKCAFALHHLCICTALWLQGESGNCLPVVHVHLHMDI